MSRDWPLPLPRRPALPPLVLPRPHLPPPCTTYTVGAVAAAAPRALPPRWCPMTIGVPWRAGTPGAPLPPCPGLPSVGHGRPDGRSVHQGAAARSSADDPARAGGAIAGAVDLGETPNGDGVAVEAEPPSAAAARLLCGVDDEDVTTTTFGGGDADATTTTCGGVGAAGATTSTGDGGGDGDTIPSSSMACGGGEAAAEESSTWALSPPPTSLPSTRSCSQPQSMPRAVVSAKSLSPPGPLRAAQVVPRGRPRRPEKRGRVSVAAAAVGDTAPLGLPA